jgi:hypothetical protein
MTTTLLSLRPDQSILRRSTAAPGSVPGATQASNRRRRRQSLAVYATSLLACLVIMFLTLKLHTVDLRVPMFYYADTHYFQVLIKGVVENSWYLDNPSVAAPLGLNMRDFPMADSLQFFLVKLIGMVARDHALTANLYFLLTFPLTTLTSLFVLRRLRCSYPPAIMGSILFTFLPYHILRGPHLFLAAYYLVPLAVLIMLRVFQEQTPFFRVAADRARLNLLSGRTLAVVLIALALSSAGVYYAFFACFFLLVAGVSASWHRRRIYPLASAILVIAWIVLGFLANYAPTLLHHLKYGVNPYAVLRIPAQSESFGLKIAQLLLPVDGHRLPRFARLKAFYDSSATPLINENGMASLGAIGACGFLFLVGKLFYRPRLPAPWQTSDSLSLLNLAAVLLGTIGGFGSVIGFTLCSWIRAYNRISIFIGFFCLGAVVMLLDVLYRKWAGTRPMRLVWMSAFAALGVVGVLDQMNAHLLPHYAQQQKEYAQEADFISRVEGAVPEHAMIYQLPFCSCPERSGSGYMGCYDHFRAYFHSRTLRWSHGGIDGSEQACWQEQIETLPLEQKIDTLCYAGFAGVYLDRRGYAAHAAELERVLHRKLGAPLVGGNERWAFYNLAAYTQSLRHTCSPETWQARQESALEGVRVIWRGGFCLPSSIAGHADRWCERLGEWHFINASPHARRVQVDTAFATNFARPSYLCIDSDLFSAELIISNVPTAFQRTIVVPPGDHLIRLRCASRAGSSSRADTPFTVQNFKMWEPLPD